MSDKFAIETRYMPAKKSRNARIVAVDSLGRKVSVSYDRDTGVITNHQDAALAHCKRWSPFGKDVWIETYPTQKGYVHVCSEKHKNLY